MDTYICMYLCIVYAKRNHKTIVIIKTRKRKKYKSENKKNVNYCTAALLSFTKKKGFHTRIRFLSFSWYGNYSI